jgi:hypothetical protein
MIIKYTPETNIHLTVKVENFEVIDSNHLSNDEIIKLFNIAFAFIKEKLGPLVQYSLMNDKIISERSIDIIGDNIFNVHCSFYWEKEYEIGEGINNFNSIKLHLNNKIYEDIKKLTTDRKFEWVYSDTHNVRINYYEENI